MRRLVRLSAVCLLGGLTVLLSGLGLVALNMGGAARIGSIDVLRVAAGYDRAADRRLISPTPSIEARSQAVQLSKRALQQFPYDEGAWLRLAYADQLEHAGLTPAGAAYLRRSYDLVAIDPVLGPLRVRLALENCRTIPKALLVSVRSEVAALSSNSRTHIELDEMARTITDPAGRLALALWLNQLETTGQR